MKTSKTPFIVTENYEKLKYYPDFRAPVKSSWSCTYILFCLFLFVAFLAGWGAVAFFDCDEFYRKVTYQFLPWSKVCDGCLDCEDLSDKGGLCTKSCRENNDGCSQLCKKTPQGSKCMCNEGYRLLHDNKTCSDVDECGTLGACSHFCENTIGSYKCNCADGYILRNDSRHCKAEGGPAVLTYVLADQLCFSDLLLNSTRCYPIGIDLRSVDFDAADGTFYCAEFKDGSIYRFSTRNFTKEIIFIPSSRPICIKYDWIAENLYLLYENSTIGVCTRDGNFCKIIVPSKGMMLGSLAIAPTHGLMFWTVWEKRYPHQRSGLIERAEMDGSHRIIIVSENAKSPSGITVDHVLQMIYWSDYNLEIVESADFHGFQRRSIVRSDAYIPTYIPFAVAVFEDDVYFTNWWWFSGAIMKCNKYTDGRCETFSDIKRNPRSLLVAHPVMQPKVNNPCQNSKCEHICVLTRSSYVCMSDEERPDGTSAHLPTVNLASEAKKDQGLALMSESSSENKQENSDSNSNREVNIKMEEINAHNVSESVDDDK